jgi:hypothetical protein
LAAREFGPPHEFAPVKEIPVAFVLAQAIKMPDAWVAEHLAGKTFP